MMSSTPKMTPGEKQLWCAIYAARIHYYWDHPKSLQHEEDKEKTAAQIAAEFASTCVGGLRRHKESIYTGWAGLSTEQFTREILDEGEQNGYICAVCRKTCVGCSKEESSE